MKNAYRALTIMSFMLLASGGGGTNCGFVTIEQCRTSISGMGGFCEPKQIVPSTYLQRQKQQHPKQTRAAARTN